MIAEIKQAKGLLQADSDIHHIVNLSRVLLSRSLRFGGLSRKIDEATIQFESLNARINELSVQFKKLGPAAGQNMDLAKR